tara:strand:- start:205 stop:405 length:201 start_codon:yes stop_codon:yes gene_type:complete
MAMNEYNFTVQQEGYIFVEADSLEEAEAILKDRINHFYVVTDNGEIPADDSWQLTGDVEILKEEEN